MIPAVNKHAQKNKMFTIGSVIAKCAIGTILFVEMPISRVDCFVILLIMFLCLVDWPFYYFSVIGGLIFYLNRQDFIYRFFYPIFVVVLPEQLCNYKSYNYSCHFIRF